MVYGFIVATAGLLGWAVVRKVRGRGGEYERVGGEREVRRGEMGL